MLVITGIFEDEKFIPDEPIVIPQKKKVVVTIEDDEIFYNKSQNSVIGDSVFKEKKIYSIGIDMKGWKYSREEANER
jgi:hypothetical protein